MNYIPLGGTEGNQGQRTCPVIISSSSRVQQYFGGGLSSNCTYQQLPQDKMYFLTSWVCYHISLTPPPWFPKLKLRSASPCRASFFKRYLPLGKVLAQPQIMHNLQVNPRYFPMINHCKSITSYHQKMVHTSLCIARLANI